MVVSGARLSVGEGPRGVRVGLGCAGWRDECCRAAGYFTVVRVSGWCAVYLASGLIG